MSGIWSHERQAGSSTPPKSTPQRVGMAVQRDLGAQAIPVHVVPLRQIVRGEFAENMARKAFTPTEEVAIWRALQPAEKGAATSRKLSGRSAENTGETRDKLGTYVGKSGRTLEKQVALVEAAEAEPEKDAKLVADMDLRPVH